MPLETAVESGNKSVIEQVEQVNGISGTQSGYIIAGAICACFSRLSLEPKARRGLYLLTKVLRCSSMTSSTGVLSGAGSLGPAVTQAYFSVLTEASGTLENIFG